MAYIPDQAFDDKNDVGQKAFDLFVFYCKHGSMSNNRVSVSLESAAEFFGIAYENICRINAVLKKKGWVVSDAGETVLLKGWEIEKTVFKSRKNRQKLTFSSVSDTSRTDDSISLEQEEVSKTDVFISFEQSETENEMSKTDESISFEQIEKCQKLTFSSVSPLEPPKGYINNTEPAQEREREGADAPAHSPEQFQTSVRNLGIVESGQNFVPRTDALAHSPPVRLFEEKFKITLGNAFAEQLDKLIQTQEEMDIWTILLTEKIAFADESEAKRKGMQRWILTAYHEKLEKKNAGNYNQKSAIERREEDKLIELSAIEAIRQRVTEKRRSRLSG